MMKLICFDKYLGIDRTKIRDSVQYRKEIFSLNWIPDTIDEKTHSRNIKIYNNNY